MDNDLEINRQRYINDLTTAIKGVLKVPTNTEDQLHLLPTKLLARQMFVQMQLNKQNHDLAYRRQIVPQTRGSIKKVVYGN
jgi:hypothetical protein